MLSRNRCDDFTASSSYQKDPIQAFSQHLQELHIWGRRTVKESTLWIWNDLKLMDEIIVHDIQSHDAFHQG